MKRIFALIVLSVACHSSFTQKILAEHHFEASDISEVSVEGAFCDVMVSRGTGLVFDGVIKGSGNPGDYLIASIRNGNTVLFKVERKEEVSWGWPDIDEALITLTVPENVALKITNSSGDVKVTDLKGGSLVVSATSGDLLIRETEADCRLRTTSGDLIARSITGGIAAKSTSGDQEYFEINGDLQTESTSGNIEVSGMKGELRAYATSGDIGLAGIRGSLEVGTTSGDIECTDVRLTGSSRFKSTSGDIYCTLENELESISFDLRATSGSLRVGGSRAEDRLFTDGGDILVRGESSSGDQVFRER